MRQTDFANDEAVGYLADRLQRLGVEDALFKAGAVAGDTVLIGDADNAVVFDWQPTLSAGAELLGGPRGTDLRLQDHSRPSRDEKRERMRDRYAARAQTQAQLDAERRAGHWATAADAADALDAADAFDAAEGADAGEADPREARTPQAAPEDD